MRRAHPPRTHRSVTAMLPTLVACVAALAFAGVAEAGEWRGGVSYQDKPAVGATVTICGQAAGTNNLGRFRVSVPDDKQSCSIVVAYQGRSSTPVQSGLQAYLSLTLRSGPDGWVIEIK